MSARPRVHTILSLLAEDHAPAHLRPSILLAVDWPSVAEEAPASEGDDHTSICAGAIMTRGGFDDLPSLTPAERFTFALLAARLAAVAASLAASSDKAMAHHAIALWGAAAALAGLLTAGPQTTRTPGAWTEGTAGHALGDLARKAGEIIRGAIATTPTEHAALIATALDRVIGHRDALCALGWDGVENLAEWTVRRKTDRERPIAKPLREILGLRPHGSDDVLAVVRNLKASEAKAHAEVATLRVDKLAALKELGGTRALCAHHEREGDNMRGRVEADKQLWHTLAQAFESTTGKPIGVWSSVNIEHAVRQHIKGAAPPVKPHPQPGDRVPWADVEDGALYWDSGDHDGCAFAACRALGDMWLYGPHDRDLLSVLRKEGYGVIHGALPSARGEAVLVARDLGTDPEVWRAAMRGWTANGNRPAAKDDDMPQPGDEDWRNGATGRVR